MEPRQAIARGLVAAVMQTGGLLKDLTVRETVQYTACAVRRHQAGRRRCWTAPASPTSPTARWPSARAVSSSGSGSRWRCCPTRRCCSSTSPRPAWTSRGGGPSGRPSAPTPSRAAPCCSRRTTSRRPTSTPTGSCWSATAADRRRRLGQRDQGAGRRPHGAGHAVATPTPTHWPPSAGSTASRCAASRCYVHAKDSDAVARYLLTQTDARDLEITSRGLEDAFLSLTGKHRHHDRRRSRPMSATVSTIDPTARRVPPLGGFSLTVLGHRDPAHPAQPPHPGLLAAPPGGPVLHLRSASRAGRTRRRGQRRGLHHGLDRAVRRGALTPRPAERRWPIERALGWSRQLRLTPLPPGHVHRDQGAGRPGPRRASRSTVVNLCGVLEGKPSMPTDTWIYCALLSLVCTVTFAALGRVHRLPGAR